MTSGHVESSGHHRSAARTASLPTFVADRRRSEPLARAGAGRLLLRCGRAAALLDLVVLRRERVAEPAVDWRSVEEGRLLEQCLVPSEVDHLVVDSDRPGIETATESSISISKSRSMVSACPSETVTALEHRRGDAPRLELAQPRNLQIAVFVTCTCSPVGGRDVRTCRASVIPEATCRTPRRPTPGSTRRCTRARSAQS